MQNSRGIFTIKGSQKRFVPVPCNPSRTYTSLRKLTQKGRWPERAAEVEVLHVADLDDARALVHDGFRRQCGGGVAGREDAGAGRRRWVGQSPNRRRM